MPRTSYRVAPEFTSEQLAQLLVLIKGVDSVELKLSVPETNRRSAIERLHMDALDAQIRQVFFFDTGDLALDRVGVVLRARRIQRRRGDSVVKLRPVIPDQLAPALRKAPNFGVEVDAMPNGFVCSGSMKAEVTDKAAKEAFESRRLRKLFTKAQRALFSAHAPDGLRIDDLELLGPINVLKLKFTPVDYGRRLVAELWHYPDGSRILELSTRCAPSEAFQVAAETKAFLADRGINLFAEQQTKTHTALESFASELASGD